MHWSPKLDKNNADVLSQKQKTLNIFGNNIQST